MAELKPDSWRIDKFVHTDDQHACIHAMRICKKPITDILTGVVYFSVMAIIISTKHPEKATLFFSYCCSILKLLKGWLGHTMIPSSIKRLCCYEHGIGTQLILVYTTVLPELY